MIGWWINRPNRRRNLEMPTFSEFIKELEAEMTDDQLAELNAERDRVAQEMKRRRKDDQ